MAEAVVLASGPSLTTEDIELVRAWRGPGRFVIVTNTTFQKAPWADVLMAMDARWWDVMGKEAKRTFTGELYTLSNSHRFLGIKAARMEFPGFKGHGNTGAASIELARCKGATRIVLAGFDCQRTNGKSHHHGDHPKPLGNCMSMATWPKQFASLAVAMKGVEVINASRQTKLTAFPRMSLEQALEMPECATALSVASA